jgi:hypothetical protein
MRRTLAPAALPSVIGPGSDFKVSAPSRAFWPSLAAPRNADQQSRESGDFFV